MRTNPSSVVVVTVRRRSWVSFAFIDSQALSTQIQERLLQLHPVAIDARECRGKVRCDRDVRLERKSLAARGRGTSLATPYHVRVPRRRRGPS